MNVKINKTLLLSFFLIMLFLTTYTHSSESLSERWTSLENYSGQNLLLNFLKDWKSLAIVSLAISIAFMALMYILGEAFDIQLLKYYFRLEFKEIIANALLIGFFVLILSFIDYVATNFGFGPNGEAICDSSSYNGFCLEDLIYDYLKDSYYDPIVEQVIKVNVNIAESSRTVGAHIGVEDIKWLYTSLGYSYDYSTSAYQNLLIRGFYEMAYVALIVTLFSLKLSKSLFGPAVIALGIILRNFFFTKRAGSTLIAVGIGIMVLYPVFMYLFYLPFFQPLSQFSTEQSNNCPQVCFDRTVAVEDSDPSKGIGLFDITNLYKQYGSASDDFSAFLNGDIREISINGKTYLSCENLSFQEARTFTYSGDDITKDVLTTTYIEINGFREMFPYGGNDNVHGLYCFPQCRVLPYPDDSVECRDAESVCRELYEEYPGCFKKAYAYKGDSNYNEVLEFYGYKGTEINEYESNCPLSCRSIPNLAPGYKGGDLGLFCPSPCREIAVDVSGTSGSLTYSLRYGDDKLPDFCKDEKYDCIREGSNNDWYDLSDANDPNDRIYSSNQWDDAISSIHSGDDSKHTYYTMKMYFSSKDAVDSCGACLTYPEPMRYYPVYIDCSGCSKNPPVPAISSVMSFTDSITLEIGKVLFLVYGIPLVALIATIYAVSGLSTYLQGDMFIPAISKIMR